MTTKNADKRPNVIPFGKYKGQPVEALAQDRQYTDWLMGQAWFRERYANYYTLIVNNFGEATETPEHNAMQAEFLDPKFCQCFLRHVFPASAQDGVVAARVDSRLEIIETHLNNLTKQRDYCRHNITQCNDVLAAAQNGTLDMEAPAIKHAFHTPPTRIDQVVTRFADEAAKDVARLKDIEGNIAEALAYIDTWRHKTFDHPPPKFEVEFEVRGWDVNLNAKWSVPECEYSYQTPGYGIPSGLPPSALSDSTLIINRTYCVEIKPSCGDDYPAILRQMKSVKPKESYFYYCCILLVAQYTGQGASLDQVRKIFEASGFQLILRSEIDAAADANL